MTESRSRVADLRSDEDLVGDRRSLVVMGMAAVLAACVIFAALRFVREWTSGQATPWWANAGGAIALTVLMLWHRGAADGRSTVAVHGTALVATVALLVPAAYGMTSSKWWLSLVGFSVLLMGRRREALVWTPLTMALLPLTALLEPRIQVPGAAGESPGERAFAGFVYLCLLLGLTAAFRRIAQRRAKELAETAASLERANLVRGRFLAHMSHEIRTPLHGVIAMTDVALASEAPAEVERPVRLAQESARVLLGLLNDLLDVSRAEAGGLELDRRPFRLHAVLGDVLRGLSAQARARGLTFEARASAGVVEQRVGDRTRVGQIAMNLAANALKFTTEGGVVVTLAQDQADGDVVEIAIRDTGSGIPAKDLERIFEAFEQVRPSDSERQSGAGLGLAIVREMAHAMDGRVSVTSEVGRGSVFTARLRLPRGADDAAGPEDLLASRPMRRAPTLEREGPPLRVLACEDGAVGQAVLRSMFALLGHSLTLVPDGAQAWALLQREQYDVLLTDVEMPLMDGIELTRRVRARESAEGGARLRVVGATAHVGEPERHRLFAEGMDAHLPKPFTLAELAAALQGSRHPSSAGERAVEVSTLQQADAVIDPAALSDLLSTDGGQELLDGLAEKFIEEGATAVGGLRAALSPRAVAEITRIAHSLRGAARVLGLVRVAELTAALESAPADRGAGALVDALEAAIPRGAAALRQVALASPAPDPTRTDA